MLKPSWATPVTLPNGADLYGESRKPADPGYHSATTRSFPAQTVPEQMVVFCSSSV